MLFLLACTVDTAPPLDTSVADSGDADTDTDTDVDTLPSDLNGTVPAAPIALPSFVARAQDGTTRTEADLLDKRVVMWFYPAANTAG
jgi:hypothetical protein